MIRVIFFALSLFCLLAVEAQVPEPVRIFDCSNFVDAWQLKISKNDSFSLICPFLFGDEVVFSGYCKTTDSTIQFIASDSLIRSKSFGGMAARPSADVGHIVRGEVFKKLNGYFVPGDMVYCNVGKGRLPGGICASYYSGDGFNSYLLQLNGDGTYKFTDHSCEAEFCESGRWAKKNNKVILLPRQKGEGMTGAVTSNNEFYIEKDILVGKKITSVASETTLPAIITEEYYYLLKKPLRQK